MSAKDLISFPVDQKYEMIIEIDKKNWKSSHKYDFGFLKQVILSKPCTSNIEYGKLNVNLLTPFVNTIFSVLTFYRKGFK